MARLDGKKLIAEEISREGRCLGFAARVSDAGAIWEAVTSKPWAKLLVQPGDGVLDCGAHIGLFAQAALDAGASVLAVEPNPDSYSLLKCNLPGTPDAATLNKAVLDRTGEFVLRCSEASPFSSSLYRETGTEVVVEAVTLQSLLESFAPTVVKVDIEGAEYSAIESVTDWSGVNWIGVEFHLQERPGFAQRAHAICYQFAEHGFKGVVVPAFTGRSKWPRTAIFARV